MGKPTDIRKKAEDKAVESELIAQLATDDKKRELYEKRAARFRDLAHKLQNPAKPT